MSDEYVGNELEELVKKLARNELEQQVAALTAENERLTKRYVEAMRGLESLTPSGSEFVQRIAGLEATLRQYADENNWIEVESTHDGDKYHAWYGTSNIGYEAARDVLPAPPEMKR